MAMFADKPMYCHDCGGIIEGEYKIFEDMTLHTWCYENYHTTEEKEAGMEENQLSVGGEKIKTRATKIGNQTVVIPEGQLTGMEASSELGTTRQTLDSMRLRGDIDAVKHHYPGGFIWLFAEEDVATISGRGQEMRIINMGSYSIQIPEGYVTAREGAEIAGVPVNTIYTWRKEGLLTGQRTKRGKLWHYKKEDIHAAKNLTGELVARVDKAAKVVAEKDSAEKKIAGPTPAEIRKAAKIQLAKAQRAMSVLALADRLQDGEYSSEKRRIHALAQMSLPEELETELEIRSAKFVQSFVDEVITPFAAEAICQ